MEVAKDLHFQTSSQVNPTEIFAMVDGSEIGLVKLQHRRPASKSYAKFMTAMVGGVYMYAAMLLQGLFG